MKEIVRFLGFAALCGVMSSSTASAAITVRATDNPRVWQTVLAPAEPIRWAWHSAADSASLTVSNELTAVSTTVTVQREEGATGGTYALSASDSGKESLYSLVLVQYREDTALSTERARLAYTPGVGDTKVTVRATRPGSWRKSDPVAVFAYDSAWGGVTTSGAGSASLSWSCADGSSGLASLDGTSGWGTFAFSPDELYSLSLFFDEVLAATGVVRWGVPGFLMFIR